MHWYYVLRQQLYLAQLFQARHWHLRWTLCCCLLLVQSINNHMEKTADVSALPFQWPSRRNGPVTGWGSPPQRTQVPCVWRLPAAAPWDLRSVWENQTCSLQRGGKPPHCQGKMLTAALLSLEKPTTGCRQGSRQHPPSCRHLVFWLCSCFSDSVPAFHRGARNHREDILQLPTGIPALSYKWG